MYDHKDIILAVDYHAENTEVRWLNCGTGEECRLNIPTTRIGILRLVEKAIAEASQVGGRVILDHGVHHHGLGAGQGTHRLAG